MFFLAKEESEIMKYTVCILQEFITPRYISRSNNDPLLGIIDDNERIDRIERQVIIQVSATLIILLLKSSHTQHGYIYIYISKISRDVNLYHNSLELNSSTDLNSYARYARTSV